MDQIVIGKYITKQRKEQNLTQEQLAELMNGEEDEKSKHTYDNKQFSEMLVGVFLIIR